MSDSTSKHSRSRQEVSPAIDVLRNATLTVPAANTQTKLDFETGATVSPSGTTGLTDLHALAESVMFDATRMVAILDNSREEPHVEKSAVRVENADLISIKSVLRAGAAVVGAFAAVCWVGTLLSGTVLLHPLIAVLLIAASIGFYIMSFLPRS
jgi:hypothetical protein